MPSLETSPDLLAWTRRETLRIGPRPVRYSDGDPGMASRRFYRVVSDP